VHTCGRGRRETAGCRKDLVLERAGISAVTVIPVSFNSLRKASEKENRNALDAAYTASNGPGATPAIDDVNRMRPCFRSTMS
jgi:hypothetical protein